MFPPAYVGRIPLRSTWKTPSPSHEAVGVPQVRASARTWAYQMGEALPLFSLNRNRTLARTPSPLMTSNPINSKRARNSIGNVIPTPIEPQPGITASSRNAPVIAHIGDLHV